MAKTRSAFSPFSRHLDPKLRQVKDVPLRVTRAEPEKWDLNDPRVQEYLDIRPGACTA